MISLPILGLPNFTSSLFTEDFDGKVVDFLATPDNKPLFNADNESFADEFEGKVVDFLATPERKSLLNADEE